MVQRTGRASNDEPEQKKFELPSEQEHLFQVVDIIENDNPDIVSAKVEVCGGDEEGRTLLNRLTLDDQAKGFFATRLFLKAICEPYKGDDFPIDTDNWIGRQFYATVSHNEAKNGKIYANIAEFNFDKIVEQVVTVVTPQVTPPAAKAAPQTEEEKAWDE